jgi:hypothetical protein
MKNQERFIKSISFDLTDEFEAELLKYAEKEYNGKKRNFSRYVKRLIQADKASGGLIGNPPTIKRHVDDGSEIYTIEL